MLLVLYITPRNAPPPQKKRSRTWHKYYLRLFTGCAAQNKYIASKFHTQVVIIGLITFIVAFLSFISMLKVFIKKGFYARVEKWNLRYPG